MLVPRYWAEHRIQLREERGPQTTIRRWGWSGTSQAEADAHARQRAEVVAAEVRAGRTLPVADRTERKVAYNGADGVPIREEILRDLPELNAVVTRNQYGAHCLNVTDVLFADIDLDPRTTLGKGDDVTGCLVVLAVVVSTGMAALHWWWLILPMAAVVATLILWRVLLHLRQRIRRRSADWMTSRVNAWCSGHPSWSVHLYRTPAGYRLIATHALFSPTNEEVARFFHFFQTDPQFVRMCRSQSCFRARLTGKPWRMGITARMGWGTWPPTSEKAMVRRQEWTSEYEKLATGYSACRFLSSTGAAVEHAKAAAVRRVHDEACRAHTDLPLA